MPHAAGIFLLGLGVLTLAGAAEAADPPKLALGVGLGYAFAAGSLERGSRVSDVSPGAVEFGVDGAYRLHRSFSAGVALDYGLVLPALCDSGDCASSLGSDVALGLLGRWHVGRWGTFVPALDLKLGYEWFSAKHSDDDVVSSRSFRGIRAAVRADGQFSVSRVFSLGPFVEVSTGIFSKANLTAPGVDRSRDVAEPAVHVWTALGVRSVASW